MTGPASRLLLIVALAAALGGAPARVASAQTPATPPSDPSQQPGQPQDPQQQQPAQPGVPAEQVPMQQYPIQTPGRPPITPASPPGTTIPPWTPPVPPPPSQTNVPSPFPFGTAGAPGGAAAGGFAGVPGLTIPGAFAPTVLSLRGGTVEFHPTLRVSEEYSDNFFQTSSHAEDNFRSTLGPGFTILMKGARTFGTLSAVVDLVHDTAKNAGDDLKVFPSLNAAIRYALTPRLSLTLTDTFVRNDAASSLDRSGIRRGRQTSNTNSAGVIVDWLADQVALQAYYRNVLFFNEGKANTANGTDSGNTTGTSQQDSITNILGVNGTTRIATDYLLRAGYEFSREDVVGGSSDANSTTNGDNTSHTVFASASRIFGLYGSGGLTGSVQYQTLNSTKIYNGSVFGAYGLPTGLSLAASVGYSILNSDTEDSQGTVSANVNASYRFTRAVISVGVFQDFVQTGQQGQNFGTVVTRSYFGSFLYQLTPFINATVNATYSENSPTGTGNVQNAGTQNTLTYGGALNWQMLRWLVARLEYAYTISKGGNTFSETTTPSNRGTAGNTGDYAENRVTLGFYATF